MTTTQAGVAGQVLDHLMGAIEATELCREPYSHFYLDQAFPDEVFRRMLELLPAHEAFGGDNPRKHTREDGRITRNVLSVSPPALAALPEEQKNFWNEIGVALTAPRLKDAVFAKLSRDLSRRFGIPREKLNTIPAYPKPALVKDLGGYEIAPHKDTRSKIVTMQFYLPSDSSKVDLGTAVYRVNWLQPAILVSPRKRFEKVKQFAFAPNSGYGFAVGSKSWHGRETVPMASGERNSLMLIFYAEPGKGW